MDDLPSPVSRRDFLAGLGMGFGYSVLVDASDFASAHAAEATPEQIRESFKLIAPPRPMASRSRASADSNTNRT